MNWEKNGFGRRAKNKVKEVSEGEKSFGRKPIKTNQQQRKSSCGTRNKFGGKKATFIAKVENRAK
jgi:hypothetical protein